MRIKNGYMKRKMADAYIVVTVGELSMTKSVIIELNEVASDIWDLVEKGLTKEEIALEIAKEYDISVEKASSSVDNLLTKMKQADVLEED